MLETLTRGFRAARDQLRGATALTDENIAVALRDVRKSLLEADVDLGIVRDFLAKVTERCRGLEVQLRAGKAGLRLKVSPGDHFTKACYDELVGLMGEEQQALEPARNTRALMLLGLQGTGKTSTAAKLALHLKRQGDRPLLVAADVYRPAAREQLQVLGEQVGVEVFVGAGDDPPAICEAALAHARSAGLGTVILDTAGRLQIDGELMQELSEIAARTQPWQSLLVCDAMAGREAINVARGFAEQLTLDGLIMTKLDGDARGGAALAIRQATGVPIRFVTMGETAERLEPFRPEGLASRILGMGDIVGLVQDFEEVVDVAQAEADAERLLEGKFSLEDFLTQLRTIQKMGPLQDLMEKLPFAGDLLPEGAQVDGKELVRIEAMILSMTPQERKRPKLIDPSRRARIARGSGRAEREISDLLQRFDAMKGMMSQLGSGGLGNLLGRLPGVGKLLGGGGMPDVSQLDPAQLAALGAGGNRRAARAAKAQQRRTKRKQLRKHKRKGKRR
jgi:signal recognition particle subunit SRP54